MLVIGGYLFWITGASRFDHAKEWRNGDALVDTERELSDNLMPGMAAIGGDQHAMHGSMMVSSEREFLEAMIPHHQEAVDTARVVLSSGGTTEGVRELVSGIIEAQEAEIAVMQEWYAAWYQEPYRAGGMYEPMVRAQEGLSGAALDRAFLEDMIAHHKGAITMARSVLAHVEHEEVRHLAEAVISTQTEEIHHMRQLLSEIR